MREEKKDLLTVRTNTLLAEIETQFEKDCNDAHWVNEECFNNCELDRLSVEQILAGYEEIETKMKEGK